MTDDPPVSRERLVLEIAWALDRHGCTITERDADVWLITTRRGAPGNLHAANLISRLLETSSFSKQRDLIEVTMRQINGDGGTGAAPRTR